MLRAAALLLLVAAVGLVASGCGSEPDRVSHSDLDGRAFASTKVTGRAVPAGATITLEFESAHLGASVGCNQIGGAYSIESGVLRQRDQFQTQMSCPGLDDFEQWLADFLAAGAKASLKGDTLTLEEGGVKVVLGETTIAGKPKVVGTAWTLVEATPRDGAQLSITKSAPPTLRLSDDDKTEIFAGCNRGGGTATFADGFVTFGPIATTRMACDPATMKLEHFVLSVLHGKAAAGFDGEGRLSLAKNGDRLLFEAK